MPSSNRQSVLIIGASGGVGQAVVRSFLKKGEDAIALHVHSDFSKGEEIIRSLQAVGRKAVLFQADLVNSVSVSQMFNDLKTSWGRLDILINAAGIVDDSLFPRLNETGWDRIVQTNLTGAFYCMREAGRLMQVQGGGHILNLSSLSAFTGRVGQAAYTASKRGLIALTLSAAREWGNDAIQVNAVLPGFLETPMVTRLSVGQKGKIVKENLLGHSSTLEEVADFIFHLSKMKNVSGQVFNLDSRVF